MSILSVGIVAYNEEHHLNTLFDDILKQTFNLLNVELLLIDSMSTDKTKLIMESFCHNYSNKFYSIRVIENKNRTQAAGWNVAINSFTGDSLTRLDAHSSIDEHFLEYINDDLNCGEYVVGGKRPCIIENDTKWGRVLLQVENSLFGSSILNSRSSNRKQYVKTMFHATYKREIFEKVGLFNESLLRTEDNEFHYRVRNGGFKLLYDPRILSFQYARKNFKSMLKQKYLNGFWIGYTSKECVRCLSLYHFIPLVFILSILVSICMLGFGYWHAIAFIGFSYLMFAAINSLISSIKSGFSIYLILMPCLFFVLHVGYGFGTLIGLFKRKKK